MLRHLLRSPHFGWVVLSAFLALSAILLWPLPLHLRSALPGDPTGDTGVYIWNLWIFRHEFLDHGHLPLSTDHIFAYSGAADFSLHNYTPLAGIIGLPLMPVLGVVGTFNSVLIGVVGASAFGVFILARRVGVGFAGAFAAGALFIAVPVITAREMAHFSLVSAAALPLFLWALLRTLDSARVRDAALVGVLAAAASYSDAYFGIYCGMMGLFTVTWRFVRVEVSPQPQRFRGTRQALTGLGALALAVVAFIVICRTLGVSELTIGSLWIGLELYTPVLVLTTAVLVNAALRRSFVWSLNDPDRRLPRLSALGALAMVTCLVLMLPTLIGIADRAATGRLPESDIFWRNSPRGVDLLSYFVPNPLHPWFGSHTSRWFMPDRENAFPEFVGSFSIVAFVVIMAAARIRQLPRFWLWFVGLFAALSLGPFLHVAGFNTYVPGPWALLRYVPVLGMARAPSRFAIVAVLGLSVLFGFAVDALVRMPRFRARLAIACVLTALALELTPVPRTLFAADVPEVYRLLATGDESAAVLELPTGVRDGTSSIGDFNASSQYFQTRHGHPLVGGYLSRVSRWRKDENIRNPALRVLTSLSEPGGTVPADELDRARGSARRFLSRSCVGYVVLNKHRASPALRDAAIDLLGLVQVHEDDQYELLRPVDPPPCDPRGGRGLRRNRLAAVLAPRP